MTYSQRIKATFDKYRDPSDPSVAHGKVINEFIKILLEEGITVEYVKTSPEYPHIKMKLDYGTLGTLRVANPAVSGLNWYRYQIVIASRLPENVGMNNDPIRESRGGQYRLGINHIAEVIDIILAKRAEMIEENGQVWYDQRLADNKHTTNNLLKGRRKKAWRNKKVLSPK